MNRPMHLMQQYEEYTDYQKFRVVDHALDLHLVVNLTLVEGGKPYLHTFIDDRGGRWIDGTHRHTSLTWEQAARFVNGSEDVIAFAEELMRKEVTA